MYVNRLYFSLRNHFEQQLHVARGVERPARLLADLLEAS
jgi:hypothetical protein